MTEYPPISRPKPIPRRRHLTPPEIEEAIQDTLGVLEDDIEMLEERSVIAARAEAAYRVGKARAMLGSQHKVVAMKEAAATVETADQLHERNIAVAMRDTAQEAMRVRRSELEALRTLAASSRAAETGRG